MLTREAGAALALCPGVRVTESAKRRASRDFTNLIRIETDGGIELAICRSRATEQHPPLYTWMCTLVTWVARILHLDPVRAFLAVVSVSCAACAFVALRIARGPAILLLGFGAAALASYGLAGGSGEQMSSAFALPYIAAAAALIQGRENGREQGKRWGIFIGVVAGIGMALKPHYALVWLLVEAAVAWQRRSWRSFLRPTSVAVFSVWIAYIAATALFTPAYFQAAMNAARYYGAFMKAELPFVLATSPYIFLLTVWLLYFLGRRWTDQAVLGRLLLLAATAMWLAGMVQMKGWYHHWTPAIGLTMAALAAPAAAQAQGITSERMLLNRTLSAVRPSQGLAAGRRIASSPEGPGSRQASVSPSSHGSRA